MGAGTSTVLETVAASPSEAGVLGHVLDALDGSYGAIPVRLALRERSWVIRLAPHNLRALEEALAPFTAAADRITRAHWDTLDVDPATGPGPGTPEPAVAFDAPTIRAWAAQQGLEVPARGALPRRVKEAYREAMTSAGGRTDNDHDESHADGRRVRGRVLRSR